MKKLLNLFLLVLSLTSCEKEVFYIECDTTYPTTQDTTIFVNSGDLEGEWLLKNATMYMTNLDFDIIDTIPLFDTTNTSSLRYGGSYYEFEDIVLDDTKWLFDYPENTPGIGYFILNGDSIVPYGLNVTSNNLTVIENMLGPQQMGGSSRPIHYQMNNLQNTLVTIEVQHTYETINGFNYYYYTQLKFKKL